MNIAIENTHAKFNDKISLVIIGLENLLQLITIINEQCDLPDAVKKHIITLNRLNIKDLLQSVQTIKTNYNLAVVEVYTDHLENPINSKQTTDKYYRVLTSDAYDNNISNIATKILKIQASIYTIIEYINNVSKIQHKLYTTINLFKKAADIQIYSKLEKYNYEECDCGTRMITIPELSELLCPNTTCGKIKTITGAVFNDNQFYPQEGQKTKHGGYESSRHYRLWIKRLQAHVIKDFSPIVLAKIKRIIDMENHNYNTLTCEVMRGILKNPLVRATNLNVYVPLLVVKFGGKPPPQLSYQEDKKLSIYFDKVITLYDRVNPTGGNKPYYPYFIYKIIESVFKDDPEKLRLLDYIHLQSRDTVIKNDIYYKQICDLADPQDGLTYTPTDPAGRS